MIAEIVRLTHDPLLLVWALFVFMIPFYVFASGLPQPGDILVIPLALMALWSWNGRLERKTRRAVSALLLFTVWVVVVDVGWALLLGNFGVFGKDAFLLFPAYYIYNTLVFLIVCVLYQRYGLRFLWLTMHIVLLSVIFQAGASFMLHRSSSFRAIGFFNNPNQLGFFALVAASIIALGKRSLGFGSLKTGLGLTGCFYLALLSASRAAVIGCGILVALTVIADPRRIAVVGTVIFGLVAVGGPISDAIDKTQQRLVENRYPQFSFLEERGYDRILANKEYWLLGAGEGGTERFAETTMIRTAEIHSSAGTIFFAYGIVGVALFLAFLARIVAGLPLRSAVVLFPTLAYTIAHQGLRSTTVWILFGLFVCIKHLRITARAPVPAPGTALRTAGQT
jgi:hypothetical protein